MDSQRFDHVTKTLATSASRRKVLGGLAIGLLGVGLGRSTVEAAKVRCTTGVTTVAECQALAPGGGEASCLRSTGCVSGYCTYDRAYDVTQYCTDKTKNVCCGLGSKKAGTCQANARSCTG